jgi:hypothetical protein
MGKGRIRGIGLLVACVCLVAAAVAVAKPSIVRTGGLELKADGEFTPHELPRNHPAPIEIEGKAGIRSTAGGPPPELEQLILDFDRDGRLSTKGLATCAPASIENLGVSAARRKCEAAIVGKGIVGAQVLIEGRWIRVNGALTLFNGPAGGHTATVIAHAQPISLPEEIYVVEIPIDRTKGEFRYRATVEVPEIFNGTGVLTNTRVKIARHYRYKGHERSYVSAQCSDGTLGVHGRLTFDNGIVIDGTVEKYCVPEGLFRP